MVRVPPLMYHSGVPEGAPPKPQDHLAGDLAVAAATVVALAVVEELRLPFFPPLGRRVVGSIPTP